MRLPQNNKDINIDMHKLTLKIRTCISKSQESQKNKMIPNSHKGKINFNKKINLLLPLQK